MKIVFSELSPEELRGLDVALKKVGEQAAARGELSGPRVAVLASIDHAVIGERLVESLGQHDWCAMIFSPEPTSPERKI